MPARICRALIQIGLGAEAIINNDRRHEVGVISNVLDTLAKELLRLAEVEKQAFERMPAVAQYGPAGDHSSDAQNILEDAADAISIHAFALSELAKNPSE